MDVNLAWSDRYVNTYVLTCSEKLGWQSTLLKDRGQVWKDRGQVSPCALSKVSHGARRGPDCSPIARTAFASVSASASWRRASSVPRVL